MSFPDALRTEPGGTLQAQLDAGPDAAQLPIQRGDLAAVDEVRRPEHTWPGSCFVGLTRLIAFGLGAGAIASVFEALPRPYGSGGTLGLAALLAAGSALQWRLAKEVERFSRWGWFGVMVEVGLATAAKLWAMATTGQTGPLTPGLVIDVIWLNYFWKRREHFDVDIGL